MSRSKVYHSIDCYVNRVTYRAVLLTPATVYKRKATEQFGAVVQEWFPNAYIEIENGPPYSDYVGEIVTVTIPEWLIDEKGWEDYV